MAKPAKTNTSESSRAANAAPVKSRLWLGITSGTALALLLVAALRLAHLGKWQWLSF